MAAYWAAVLCSTPPTHACTHFGLFPEERDCILWKKLTSGVQTPAPTSLLSLSSASIDHSLQKPLVSLIFILYCLGCLPLAFTTPHLPPWHSEQHKALLCFSHFNNLCPFGTLSSSTVFPFVSLSVQLLPPSCGWSCSKGLLWPLGCRSTDWLLSRPCPSAFFWGWFPHGCRMAASVWGSIAKPRDTQRKKRLFYRSSDTCLRGSPSTLPSPSHTAVTDPETSWPGSWDHCGWDSLSF